MSLDDLSSQLGPLPESDENARLQRESIKALNRLLAGLNDLLFRDERTEDYGVDGSFELNITGRMTNIRAQVQMKGTAHAKGTNAGYVPLKVRTANLNYLLNGASPIYVLWNEQADELWYLWAQEENRRLLKENPSWTQQEWITLQFRNRFTREAVPAIVKRILQEGLQHREIRDHLARATEGEHVFIRINADSLQITDARMAASLLLASGTAIVAAGYPQQVLDLMRLVEPSERDLPRMQLTIGYAEYLVGNHWEALGHVRRAMARERELSARDSMFLATLKDASELHAGLIESATYVQRMSERAKTLTGLPALEAQQDALYRRCVRATNLAQRSEDAKELRAVTERILHDAQVPPPNKLSSRLLLLFVEGVEANLAATRTEFAAELRRAMFPGDVQGVANILKNAQQRRQQWETQAAEALKDAYELNHPILIFQALIVFLRIRIGRLFEQRMDAIVHKTSYEVGVAARSSIERIFEEASKLNEINGSSEGRLEIEELRADFLELQGNQDAARKLASQIYPVAQAMGFGPIAQKARLLLDDETLLRQWERTYKQLEAEDEDLQKANQSDEQLNRIASQILLSLESPPARLEVLVEHLRSFRQISRERVNWCRHLQILEDLTITNDPKTAYSELPTRKCLCDRFGHTTADASTDASAVISEFKQHFCASCPARAPKRT